MSETVFPVLVSINNHTGANNYQLDFPNAIDLSNYSVGVGNAYIYYSWYNISNSLNNRIFQLDIPGMSTQTITLPEGVYEISNINQYLQYWFIENDLYITNNTTGENTYYGSFQVSPTSYKIQFLAYTIPAALPGGYTSGGTNMNNAFTDSGGLKCMQLTVLSSNNFKDIIGFNAGTYPTLETDIGTPYTKESDYVPNVSPISAIQMRLNCCFNQFSFNSQLLHIFTNKDATVGEQIDASPNTLQFVPTNGVYSSIILSFYDQNGIPLQMNDPNITIKLIFKKEKI